MNDQRTRFEIHLEADRSGRSAVEWLAAHSTLSRGRIKAAMANGAAWLDNTRGIHRCRRAGRQLTTGERLHFYYDPRVLEQEPPAARLVADEGGYSVWDKPFGMRAEGSKWGDHCTLYRYAECHLEPRRPAYPVHRLDRATRGLMLLAHDRRTAAALAAQFERREIDKRYHAIVEGRFDRQLPFEIEDGIDGKPAHSIALDCRYDAAGERSLLTLRLLTGRKHQLRRHLAAAGFPIIGDRRYGSQRLDCDLQLQAYHLAFTCPQTGEFRRYEID